jgi:hypothetical protein
MGQAQAGQLSNEQIYTPWRTTMKRLILEKMRVANQQ